MSMTSFAGPGCWISPGPQAGIAYARIFEEIRH